VLPAKAEKHSSSDDFRFAAAVAEFGLLLRDSPYRGAANLANVLSRAEQSLGADPNGHRREFVELVRKAMELRRSAP
jgi:Ca-activated chloride channel family protein